jgi:two-component system KDP operon response regulator KdpE
MTKILIIDDELQIRRALDINLRIRGYDVLLADTGEEGLKVAASGRPDAVVLDLGLPGIGGLDVVRGIRGWSQVPIVILSVRESETEKVAALDAGADDYVTKPFGMDELLARLRAALRRAAPPTEEATILAGDLEIDLADRRVRRQGADVRLTPTEWHLVEVLAKNQGRLVTQGKLLQEVWGPSYQRNANYLRVYMAQIRRKLEADAAHPRHFLTEPGMGYRLVV